jgi:hypothetical protein
VKSKIVNLSEIQAHPNMSLSPVDYIKEQAEAFKSGGNVGISIDWGKEGGDNTSFSVMDAHSGKAMELFNCKAEEVSPEMQKIGKAFNFGETYGAIRKENAIKFLEQMGIQLNEWQKEFLAFTGKGKSRFIGDYDPNSPISSYIDSAHYRNGKTLQLFNLMYRWITEDNATYSVEKDGISFIRNEEKIFIATKNPRQFIQRFNTYRKAFDNKR